jgi:hypothetical protein
VLTNKINKDQSKTDVLQVANEFLKNFPANGRSVKIIKGKDISIYLVDNEIYSVPE